MMFQAKDDQGTWHNVDGFQAAALRLDGVEVREVHETIIKVWSNYGNTPITKRGGNYCDELLSITVHCATPEESRAKTQELIKTTAHGYSGWFHMPDYPNQNTRSAFV